MDINLKLGSQHPTEQKDIFAIEMVGFVTKEQLIQLLNKSKDRRIIAFVKEPQ